MLFHPWRLSKAASRVGNWRRVWSRSFSEDAKKAENVVPCAFLKNQADPAILPDDAYPDFVWKLLTKQPTLKELVKKYNEQGVGALTEYEVRHEHPACPAFRTIHRSFVCPGWGGKRRLETRKSESAGVAVFVHRFSVCTHSVIRAQD